MNKPSALTNVYEAKGYVVRGPGVFLYLDNEIKASTIAASLNTAYALGFADRQSDELNKLTNQPS